MAKLHTSNNLQARLFHWPEHLAIRQEPEDKKNEIVPTIRPKRLSNSAPARLVSDNYDGGGSSFGDGFSFSLASVIPQEPLLKKAITACPLDLLEDILHKGGVAQQLRSGCCCCEQQCSSGSDLGSGNNKSCCCRQQLQQPPSSFNNCWNEEILHSSEEIISKREVAGGK